MTLLVVGVSHRTAPVSLLERIALVDESVAQLQADLIGSPHVAESMVLSTCNRVEVYAEVSRFHGGVVDVTETLSKVTGVARSELTPHLYVRYEDRAVQHAFEVAAGLDSMVIGEQQILGQVRTALRQAQDAATAGKSLNDLAQAALRVGKRIHHDTGIDRAGASVVSVALELAEEVLAHTAAIAAHRVEPIVVSLRSRADDVVEAELQRLRLRLPHLDDEAALEMAKSLRRVVSTLLHTPTVRMKELAADPDGARYATALHRLFDLDPEAIEAVSAAEAAARDAASDGFAPREGEASYDELLGGLS